MTGLVVAGCADRDAAQGKINTAESKLALQITSNSPSRSAPSDVTASYDIKTGRSVFTRKCLSCHGDGVKGAPKLGDVTAWADRVEQDLGILVRHAIDGRGRMPPKGGFSELSDSQVASAVAYVVNKSQRLITAANIRKHATECHPISNPTLCTEEELRDALTLHMMWLLTTKERGS